MTVQLPPPCQPRAHCIGTDEVCCLDQSNGDHGRFCCACLRSIDGQEPHVLACRSSWPLAGGTLRCALPTGHAGEHEAPGGMRVPDSAVEHSPHVARLMRNLPPVEQATHPSLLDGLVFQQYRQEPLTPLEVIANINRARDFYLSPEGSEIRKHVDGFLRAMSGLTVKFPGRTITFTRPTPPRCYRPGCSRHAGHLGLHHAYNPGGSR